MKTLIVKEHILKANARAAAENRAEFSRRGITVVNLIGSPGSGKTALLERLARHPEVHFAALGRGQVRARQHGSQDARGQQQPKEAALSFPKQTLGQIDEQHATAVHDGAEIDG